MRSFWLLTGFEYKKLFQRKIVWITLAVMIAACILLSCISYMATGYTIDGEPVNGYDLKKKHMESQDKIQMVAVIRFLMQIRWLVICWIK